MLYKTALEVGSLVLVDDTLCCELVQHSGHLRKFLLSLFLVCSLPQSLDGVAGSLCIIVVMLLALCGLAYALVCTLMICHK